MITSALLRTETERRRDIPCCHFQLDNQDPVGSRAQKSFERFARHVERSELAASIHPAGLSASKQLLSPQPQILFVATICCKVRGAQVVEVKNLAVRAEFIDADRHGVVDRIVNGDPAPGGISGLPVGLHYVSTLAIR